MYSPCPATTVPVIETLVAFVGALRIVLAQQIDAGSVSTVQNAVYVVRIVGEG